jgi:uncharacterized protein (TIGR02266 family)
MGGLTPRELQRWMLLKRTLNQQFAPGADAEKVHRRESLRVPARVGVSFRSLGELRECLMTNLSRGGLFVATDSPLEIGTRFELRIEMEKTGEIIEVPVEVVSQNARPDRGTFEPGIGVQFCEMPPAVRAKLDKLYEIVLKQAGERIASDRKAREPAPRE